MSRGFDQQELLQETVQVYHLMQGTISFHTHPFLELAYIVRGSLEHTFGNTCSTVRAGDYFVVDYGVPHGYRQIDDKPCEIINCLFLPELIDRSLEGCRSIRTILNNYIIRLSPGQLPDAPTAGIFHDEGTVLALLEDMIRETDEHQQGYREVVRCDLVKILLLTMRALCVPTTAPAPLSRRIIRRMEQDCANMPTLSALAEEMHFSVSTLSNRFRAEAGKGYSAYLQQVRMETACRLLTGSDRTIAEVAATCGYRDMKTFYNVFHQHMGISPGRFRRQYE